jgi:hypothetical protein
MHFEQAPTGEEAMGKLVLRLATIAALAASATVASGRVEAAPIAAPNVIDSSSFALTQPAQFIYLGRPFDEVNLEVTNAA